MEKTTIVTETFEWCHLCKAFDAVTEKVCIDGVEQPVHTVCRNNDICWSAELAKAALEGDKEEMAIDALEQEPRKGEWIPCSERLPEKS